MTFTIGLPVIKSEFLLITIESIISQTFTDFEVILQNNASNEGEKQIIKDLAEKYLYDKRFKYFENIQQLSMYDNFNDVLNKSHGNYFNILSDDDVIAPDFLMRFNVLIEKYNDLDVFHCRAKMIDAAGRLIEISPLCPEFESQADFIYHRLWNKRIQFLSDFVVRKEKFKEIGGFDKFKTGWGLDDLAWFKMAKRGIGYTSNIGLQYRVHPGNVSSTKNYMERFDDIDFFIHETHKIISHPDFIKGSIYPLFFFEKKLMEHKNSKNWYIFTEFISNNNIWFILKFYLQNRKKYQFKLSLVYKALARKFKNA